MATYDEIAQDIAQRRQAAPVNPTIGDDASAPAAPGPSLPYEGEVQAASKVYPAATPDRLHALLNVESRHGTSAELDQPGPMGRGDGGHGHGLMQIDDRYHADFLAKTDESGAPLWQQPAANIGEGARIFQEAWDGAAQAGVPEDQREEVALNAYNHGLPTALDAWRNGTKLDYAAAVQNAMGSAPAEDPDAQEPRLLTDADLHPDGATNPYDAAALEIANRRKQQDQGAARFLAWKAQNANVPPDQALDVLRYSEQSGKAPEFVAQHLDLFKKDAQLDDSRWMGVVQRSPALQSWMHENSIRAAAVKDDVDNLGWLEAAASKPWAWAKDAVQGVSSFGPALRDSTMEQWQVGREILDLVGLGSGDNTKAINELETEYGGEKDYGVKTGVGKAIVGVPKMLPMVAGDLVSRGLGGGIGAVVGLLSGGATGAAAGLPEGGVGALPGAFVGGIGGAGAGAETGQLMGSGLFNGLEAAGQIDHALQGVRDADGNPLNPTVRKLAAWAGGLGTGALMAVAGGPVGRKLAGFVEPVIKYLPGGDAILGRYGKDAVVEAIAKSGWIRNSDRLFAQWTEHELAGGFTMAVQSAISQASQEAARQVSGESFDAKWERVGMAFKESLAHGLEDMPLMALWSARGDVVAAQKRALVEAQGRESSSVASAAQTRATIEAAASSSTLKNLPPRDLQDLLNRIDRKPAAAKTIYVAPEALDRLAQTRGLDPKEFSKQLVGDDGSAYHEATSTGGDVAVPASSFRAFAAHDKDAALGLWEDSRLNQDEFTPRQIRQRQARMRQRVEQLSAVPMAEMNDSERQVYEDLRARAVAAKVPDEVADLNARATAALFGAKAEQFREDGAKVDAWDLYKPNAPKIVGPRLETLETAPGAEPPARQAMRKAVEGFTRDEQHAAFFRDEPTGLLHMRGYEALRRELPGDFNFGENAKPDAKPFTATFQPVGVKPLNDHLGHDATDQALKVLANALRDKGEHEGVRRGNTISLDLGPDEATARAHAAELAKAMSDRLGVPVAHGVVAGEGLTPKDRVEAADEALRQAKAADPNVPHRKAFAPQFTEGEPAIDYEAGQPVMENGREKVLPTGEPQLAELKPDHLHPASPEAKDVEKRAAERARPLVDRWREEKLNGAAEITPQHEETYADHILAHDPFDTIHLTPEGLLTEQGFRLAEKVSIKQAQDLGEKLFKAGANDQVPLRKWDPKTKDFGEPVLDRDGKPVMVPRWRTLLHYVSADARGIADLDRAFGRGLGDKLKHGPADQIMGHIAGVLHDLGGPEFNVARPHGDEFYAVVVGENPRKVERLFAWADEALQRTAFWRLDGDKAILVPGARLAHGIGPDFDTADREALPAAKRDQSVERPRLLPLKQFQRVERDLRGKKHELVRVGGAAQGESSGAEGAVGPGRRPGGAAEAGGSGGGAGGRGVAGREDGAAGGGGVRSPALHVAEEVTTGPGFNPPTEAAMSAAREFAARMTSLRKAQTEDALAFTRDYLAGRDVERYGDPWSHLQRDIVRGLAAKFGIVDPVRGFADEEALRRGSRGGKRRRRDIFARDTGQADKRDEFFSRIGRGEGDLQQPAAPPEQQGPRNLVVQHNLTEDNLAHADQFGGLAAPSLAIARKEHPLTGFGEVTLLGDSGLVDPARGNPTFGSDIYSTRHPRAQFDVNVKPLRALEKELRPFASKSGAYIDNLEGEVERWGAAKAIEERSIRPALELAYLKEKGVDLPPVMRDVRLDSEISDQPALRKFFKDHGVDHQFEHGSRYHQDLSEAVRKAIDEYAEHVHAAAGDAVEDIARPLREELLDENGQVLFGRTDRLLRDAPRVGTKELDKYGYQDAIAAKVKELGEAEFKRWAVEKLKPLEGKPFIPRVSETTGNVRRIPYTLENVLKEVTKKVRQGEDFNYGLGTARAAGSKRFRSIEDIQAARDKITSKAEFDKVKAANDERFGDLAEELRQYHRDPSGFHVLDGLAQAIGESYKRGHYLREELRRDGFEGVPPELVGKVSDFARDLLAMPTEYFESKPQRAVGIGEFRAAVVPHDASQETLDILRKHGIRQVAGYERGNEEDRQAAVARMAESQSLLFQPNEGGRFDLASSNGRGYIKFSPPGGGEPRSFEIRLLHDADPSTLAHELMHWTGQVLGDLAQRPDAPQALKDDYNSLIRWMGYDSHEQRVAEDLERRELNGKRRLTKPEQERLRQITAKEERLTHAWEQYLLEGRPPSVELAGVFQRFRNWLVGIYRNVRTIQRRYKMQFGQDLGLNDQVRAIFGRMLASADAVDRAMSAAEQDPFRELAAEQMTPEERAHYEETSAKAVDDAKSEIVRRIAREQRRANDDFARARRQEFRDQAVHLLSQDRDYRAARFLREGDMPESPGYVPDLLRAEGGAPAKLDRAAVEAAIGKDAMTNLPRGIYADEGGKSPDELAEPLGFQNGQELLEALGRTVARPPEDVIQEHVERRMNETYGSALEDNPTALADEALKAIPNESAIEKAMLERRALARKLDPNRPAHELDLDLAGLKDTVREMVAKKSVGELLAGREGSAGYYRRNARTAVERMRKAFEAGKTDQALAYNETHLVNLMLWREAVDARERLSHQLDVLKRSARQPWRAALGQGDVAAGGETAAYRNAHDAILQAVGIRPQEAGAVPAQALAALVKRAAEDLEDLPFDQEQLSSILGNPKPYRALTQEQAQVVFDAVTSIRHLANDQTEIFLAGKRVARDAWLSELEAKQEGKKKLPPGAYLKSEAGIGQKAAGLLRGVDAWLTEIDPYLETLDDGDRKGPAQRLFRDQRLACRAAEVELNERVLEPFREAVKELEASGQGGRLHEEVEGLDKLLPVRPEWADQVEPIRTRAGLLTLALHWGDADNRQRVIDGNGWPAANVEAALDRLTPAEGRFVQRVFDLVHLMYPDLSRAYERREGLPMGKVQAVPLRMGGEEFPGGYFPIRYDPRFAHQGRAQEADLDSAQFAPSPVVQSGHTKARVQRVNAPVSMEFSVLGAHLAAVKHDIAYGDWVREAARTVKNQRFRNVVTTRLGPERLELLMPWLRSIANEASNSVAEMAEGTTGFQRTFERFMKSRALRSIMSGNLPSIAAHLTDPLVAAADAVGPVAMAKRGGYLAQSYLDVLAPWKWGDHPEFKLSKEIAYREGREAKSLQRELAKFTAKPLQKVDMAVEHTANLARFYVDRFNERVTWLIGYREGLAQGMTQEEAAQHGDDVLSRNIPSGDIAERSAILRSKTGSATVLATLYGYANKMFQVFVHRPLARLGDSAPNARPWRWAPEDWRNVGSSAADLAAKWVAMGAIASAGAWLAGRGPQKRDKEGWKEWIGLRTLLEPLNTLPAVGSVIEAKVEGRPVSVRTAPAAQYIGDTVNTIANLVKEAHEGKGTDARVWAALNALFVALGPSGQLQRTGGFIHQVHTGQERPSGARGYLGGLIYGPERKR